MRAFMSYGIALVIIVVIAVWMGSGVIVNGGHGPGNGEKPVVSLFSDSEGTKTEEDATGKDGVNPHLTIAERAATNESADKARSVRIKTYTAQPMPLQITLRGQTKANATVTAAAETSGTVDKVAVEKGQTVEAGDLLCQLDQGTRQAALAQAQAAVAQAEVAFSSNQSLRDKGLAPANSGNAAEASLKAAQASLKQARAELDRTEIRAKVGGIVQEPLAEVGSLLNAGQPCATIVQLNPIKFVGSIPEARIGLARTGLPVSVTTIDGQTAEGKVTFISSTADPATRTFKAEAEIANPNGKIRDGLTADATVDMGVMPAQLLPQSVLTLNDDGTLGIRAVKDSKVEFYPVDILKDTRDGVWVNGLPGTVDVITVGQEYVKAGETVDAQKYDEGQAS